MMLDVGEDRKRKAAERVKRASVAPTSLFGCASSTYTPLALPCIPLHPLAPLYNPSNPLTTPHNPARPRTIPFAPLQAQGPGLRRARAGHRRGACRGAAPRGAGGGGGSAGEGARCGEGQVREGSARKDEGAVTCPWPYLPCPYALPMAAAHPPSRIPPRAPLEPSLHALRPSLHPLRPHALATPP